MTTTNDSITALQEQIKKTEELQLKIFEGSGVEIHINDSITKICDEFNSDFYQTGVYIEDYYEKYDLDNLEKIAKPSKFGLGTETVYDPNVRNSLEIMADKLDPKFIEELKSEIKVDKLATNYELRPYKLVFYGKGCFFVKHKDTIRDPKHIGTVSFILKNAKKGGQFILSHNDKKKIFSNYGNRWIALYGDVFHEVTEVTYGMRVSFLFDIYLTDGDNSIDNLRNAVSTRLNNKLIDAIKHKLKYHNGVVIGMYHEYSKAQLDSRDLKNRDACIYEVINKHFNVSIELLRYYTFGYGDDVYEERLLDVSEKLDNCYVSFVENVHKDGKSIFTYSYPYTGNDGGDSKNLYLWGGFMIKFLDNDNGKEKRERLEIIRRNQRIEYLFNNKYAGKGTEDERLELKKLIEEAGEVDKEDKEDEDKRHFKGKDEEAYSKFCEERNCEESDKYAENDETYYKVEEEHREKQEESDDDDDDESEEE